MTWWKILDDGLYFRLSRSSYDRYKDGVKAKQRRQGQTPENISTLTGEYNPAENFPNDPAWKTNGGSRAPDDGGSKLQDRMEGHKPGDRSDNKAGVRLANVKHMENDHTARARQDRRPSQPSSYSPHSGRDDRSVIRVVWSEVPD